MHRDVNQWGNFTYSLLLLVHPQKLELMISHCFWLSVVKRGASCTPVSSVNEDQRGQSFPLFSRLVDEVTCTEVHHLHNQHLHSTSSTFAQVMAAEDRLPRQRRQAQLHHQPSPLCPQRSSFLQQENKYLSTFISMRQLFYVDFEFSL